MKNNFTENEFKCKCGCGMDVLQELKDLANKARNISNTPYVITSGARCKEHNAKVGGVADSAHIYGEAMDIRFIDSKQCFLIMNGLLQAGFKRIGINFQKSFIHADISKTKPSPSLFKY